MIFEFFFLYNIQEIKMFLAGWHIYNSAGNTELISILNIEILQKWINLSRKKNVVNSAKLD